MGAPVLLYPSMGLTDDERLELTLSDPARVGQPDREIPVAFYWSSAAPLPMPGVVLSPGGAFGHDDPRSSRSGRLRCRNTATWRSSSRIPPERTSNESC